MKKILFFLLLAVCSMSISAQGPSKKCPVCGLSIPKCQYKGKHPKVSPSKPTNTSSNIGTKSNAYGCDFVATTVEGVKIYYKIISSNTCKLIKTNIPKVRNNSEFYFKPKCNRVTIPSSVEYNNNKYNITIIGKMAFDHAAVKRIVIPNTVTIFDPDAFYYSTVSELNIPLSVQKIGDYCFHVCKRLNNIAIPEGITVLGKSTFGYCDHLKRLTLPKSLKQIDKDAFWCVGDDMIINYNGNIEDWRNIKNDDAWLFGRATIHCIDGNITL